MAPRASSESSSENKTGETMPIRRARAAAGEVSRARPPAQTKRGRHDEVEVDDPAPPSSALRVRMDKELLALQGLVKRAKLLLPRSGADDEKKCAPAEPPRRSEAPPVVPTLKPATEAAYAPAKQQQRASGKKTEAPIKKRRRVEEELARAVAREEFRRMLQEMEKTALPDETVYPEDLKELGIAFEHVVTRTKKEAWLEDHRRTPAARLHGVGMTVLAV